MDGESAVRQLILRARGAGVGVGRWQEVELLAVARWLGRVGEATGISGYETPEEAVRRAMLPAVAYFEFDQAPLSGEMADLGAGNGALGATIAILAPDLQVDLVDRAERAYTACELLVARLELSTLRAVRRNVGEGSGGSYDAVVFRALASGAVALGLAAGMTRAGGFVGAYHRRGDREFDGDRHGLDRVRTVATGLPGLVVTGYRI